MSRPVRQSVLGCGRWGSFHLWYGSRCRMKTIGWEPPESIPFRELQRDRSNAFLKIPDDVVLTTNLEEALEVDQIIVSVPAQIFRKLASELASYDLSAIDLVLCMKGLERGTGCRLSRIAEEEGVRPGSLSIWVGPGHPQQFIKGVPSCMLIASEDSEAAERIATGMSSELIRLYRSRDLTGCEIGAAAKNVVGIASGILDGLGLSGLKGALMARAPQEVARLVSALGGDWRSVYGLSHLGDYEATLFSAYSRNRAFGESVACGGEVSGLAEGVETSRAMMFLGKRLGVDLPITGAVRKIIDGDMSPGETIDRLFGRPEKEEFPDSF